MGSLTFSSRSHCALGGSFSPDGSFVLGNFMPMSEFDNGLNLMMWNAHTGDCTWTFTEPMFEPEWWFSRDGSLVLTSSWHQSDDGTPSIQTISVWDVKSGDCIREFQPDDCPVS